MNKQRMKPYNEQPYTQKQQATSKTKVLQRKTNQGRFRSKVGSQCEKKMARLINTARLLTNLDYLGFAFTPSTPFASTAALNCVPVPTCTMTNVVAQALVDSLVSSPSVDK